MGENIKIIPFRLGPTDGVGKVSFAELKDDVRAALAGVRIIQKLRTSPSNDLCVFCYACAREGEGRDGWTQSRLPEARCG